MEPKFEAPKTPAGADADDGWVAGADPKIPGPGAG